MRTTHTHTTHEKHKKWTCHQPTRLPEMKNSPADTVCRILARVEALTRAPLHASGQIGFLHSRHSCIVNAKWFLEIYGLRNCKVNTEKTEQPSNTISHEMRSLVFFPPYSVWFVFELFIPFSIQRNQIISCDCVISTKGQRRRWSEMVMRRASVATEKKRLTTAHAALKTFWCAEQKIYPQTRTHSQLVGCKWSVN